VSTALRQTTPAFISPGLWPLNHLHVNAVDFKMWGIVQQRVYQSRVLIADKLKQLSLEIWHRMQQTIIDNVINEWCNRLKACVLVKGVYFEHRIIECDYATSNDLDCSLKYYCFLIFSANN